jgi:hypothetical protein
MYWRAFRPVLVLLSKKKPPPPKRRRLRLAQQREVDAATFFRATPAAAATKPLTSKNNGVGTSLEPELASESEPELPFPKHIPEPPALPST